MTNNYKLPLGEVLFYCVMYYSSRRTFHALQSGRYAKF